MSKKRVTSYRFARVTRGVWKLYEINGHQEKVIAEDVHNIVWARFRKMIQSKAEAGELNEYPSKPE